MSFPPQSFLSATRATIESPGGGQMSLSWSREQSAFIIIKQLMQTTIIHPKVRYVLRRVLCKYRLFQLYYCSFIIIPIPSYPSLPCIPVACGISFLSAGKLHRSQQTPIYMWASFRPIYLGLLRIVFHSRKVFASFVGLKHLMANYHFSNFHRFIEFNPCL